MADSTLQEAIRIVLETQGREGVDALRKALEGVGDVSADTVRDTDRLLDSLAGLNETAAKAARFGELSAELASTTEALDNASAAALQLNLQLGQTDKPTKEMQQAYRAVRDEVTRLQGVQAKQADAAERVGRELREQGFDTQALAGASRQLRTQIEGTTAALQKQVGVVEREAGATRKHKQALAEQDAQFRKLVESGHASAAALEKYRADAIGAAEGSRRLAGEGGRLGRIFGGLRSIIAPVLGYLTFRTALEGIKNLAGVGSAAENARRSLANLYGSQAAGNRAYEDLRTLAKQNGLAFADVLETAKKLKAFGLDPLNGSLQSLIDQNAAVGGAMEDLDGKVLALGQAWAKQKLQGEEILQLVERGVPVWDLLQKATGKNVQELQKLSSAGKLGRDTISALVAEIGKANSGAAARGLSGLTGLIAQTSARWQDFLQKVADSGVTDYFKKQLESLLGSTGNLDQLAGRVGQAIINVVEQVKRFGQAIAPVAAAIGNFTLVLANNAGTLGLTAAAWALFRFTEWAAGFARLTTSVRGTTAALVAQRSALIASASAAAGGGWLGRLAGGFTGLGIRIVAATRAAAAFVGAAAVPLAVITGVALLTKAYEGVNAALVSLEASEARVRQLHRDNVRVGQQLQTLYRQYADTVIASSAEIERKTRDQSQAYLFSLQSAQTYYRGVVKEAVSAGRAVGPEITAALQRIDVAIKQTTTHLEDLSKKAASDQALRAFVDNAVAKFDEVASKTGKVKDAVSGIFTGLDIARLDGLQQAVSIIDQVSIRGVAAADAIQGELRTALMAVADRDLPSLKAAAEQALGAGTQGAKLFADEVRRINLSRLGVDVEAIKTGFTKAGRSAVDSFRAAIDEVGRLGLTAEQRGQAIAQAFDNAFKQASTKQEIAALKQALVDALSAGSLGFQDFQKRIAETDAKLAALNGSAANLDLTAGTTQATAALDDVGQAATAAGAKVEDAGDKAEEAGEKASESAKGVDQMTASFASMSQKAYDALFAQNRLVAFQDIWLKSINAVTGEWRRQSEAVSDLNKQLDEQLAAFDPLTAAVKELQRQYGYVDDATLRALAEKQQRLQQEEQRAKEEQRRAAEEGKRARAEADRAREPTATGATPASARGATAARAAPVAGSAGVMATLRLVVDGAGSVDLTVPRAQAEDLLADIRRAASVSQKRRGG